MYKLTITKYVENTNYEAEMEEYKKPYGAKTYDSPKKTIEVRALEVELTDEEFAKMKKEVLTVFE